MKYSITLSILAFAAAACGEVKSPDDLALGNPNNAPAIESVSPERGPLAGGTEVTVTGTDFLDGSVVILGGEAVTDVTVVDDTTLTFVTPGGRDSDVAQDLIVFGPDGTGFFTDAFTYNAVPVADTVTPSFADLNGGAEITIKGTGFELNQEGDPVVLINGEEAEDVTVVDDNTITAVAPGGNEDDLAIALDVEVQTANGDTVIEEALTYLRPGLLFAAGDVFGVPSGFGIYYYDIPTERIARILPLDTGVGRFLVDPAGRFLMRLNNRGALGGNGRILFLEQTFNETEPAFAGSVTRNQNSIVVRSLARQGQRIIGVTDNGNQIGEIDPDTLVFTDIGLSAPEFRGCLLADGPNILYHFRNENQTVVEFDTNNLTSTDIGGFTQDFPDSNVEYRCHGATQVGNELLMLWVERRQHQGRALLVRFNRDNMSMQTIAELPRGITSLQPTPFL